MTKLALALYNAGVEGITLEDISSKKQKNSYSDKIITFGKPKYLGDFIFKMSGLCEIYRTLPDGRNYRNTKRAAGPNASVIITVFGTPNQLNYLEKGNKTVVGAYLTRKKITQNGEDIFLDNLDLQLEASEYTGCLHEIKIGERLPSKVEFNKIAEPIQGGYIFSV